MTVESDHSVYCGECGKYLSQDFVFDSIPDLCGECEHKREREKEFREECEKYGYGEDFDSRVDTY